MVAHNRLEVRVVTGINFGNFTALLTIICHQKSNYFFFWRYYSGLAFSHLYKVEELYRYKYVVASEK